MFFFYLLLLVRVASGTVQFVGVNLAGFDFGCGIDGTCTAGEAQSPSDFSGQISHFTNDDQMNIYRLPVSWQFLTNTKIGGALDSDAFEQYDLVMQACLTAGASCVIDIHNYARVDAKIIGQGGPTDAQFADLWHQLATKYKASDKVIFGVMNEPHDLDIDIWAKTVQAAVTAIRTAGATSQMILMPGTDFTSAGQFVPNGSGAALLKVVNPDNSTTGLIMDLHKYLDTDNSGTHSTCTTNNIDDAFSVVGAFLKSNNRLALISETGAGNDTSCLTDFCAQNAFLDQNSDVFLGYTAWAAGSFDPTYVLSLTPTKQDGKYVDNELASQCIVKPWLAAGAGGGPPTNGTVGKMTTLTQVSTRTRVVATVTSTALNTNSTGIVTATGLVGSSLETLAPLQVASAASKTTATRNLCVGGLLIVISVYILS